MMLVEVKDYDMIDSIVKQELFSTYQTLLGADERSYGKGLKKDLKALKRVYNMYVTTEDRLK